jgi:hypothetical protein
VSAIRKYPGHVRGLKNATDNEESLYAHPFQVRATLHLACSFNLLRALRNLRELQRIAEQDDSEVRNVLFAAERRADVEPGSSLRRLL